MRIVTPPPEEKISEMKESPPVPAFDPRVNIENSVRKALGSKTREEERAERKARMASLKAAHFGAGASGNEIVKRVPESELKVSTTNAQKPGPLSPTSPTVPVVKPFKMTTYMSKEFTKLPGSSTINVENKFNSSIHVPIKTTGLTISKDTGKLILQQSATETAKMTKTGQIIESNKSIESKATMRPMSVNISSPVASVSSSNQPKALEGPSPISPALSEPKVTEPKSMKSPTGSQTKSPSSSISAFSSSLFGSRTSSMSDSRPPSGVQKAPQKLPAKGTKATVDTVSKSVPNSNPLAVSPGSESVLSGSNSTSELSSRPVSTAGIPVGTESQQVKHTKLNSTVKVTLLDSRPQPILSYKTEKKEDKDTLDRKSQVCLTDLDDPGIVSDTAQVKSPKSGSMKFFKKFKSSFSSDKEAKLAKMKHQKSTPALNDGANYLDEQQEKTKTLGAETSSPNLFAKKDKNFFTSHFRIKSATLKNEKLGGMPNKESNKSDSKLGLHVGTGHQRKSSQSFREKPTSQSEKRRAERKSEPAPMSTPTPSDDTPVTEKRVPTIASSPAPSDDTPVNERKELPFPTSLPESGAQKGSPEPASKKDFELRTDAPLAEPETKVEDEKPAKKQPPASPEKTPEVRPETPTGNKNENKVAAEILKSNRKARQTKQKEKIKQMQLKLGLKYLPGTLDSKIDSITDFCSGRRTSGVNKDLDDLYNEVASTEKDLPYYKQTDLRRSMEKLTDRTLQSFEILLENDVPGDANVNGKTNGIENGHREKELVQMEIIAKRMENLEHVNRCQNLERVTREIAEKEVILKTISERGEAIEKSLLDKKLKKKDKPELTQKWVEVKQELDNTTAEISELVYTREQLILDVRHYNLKQEIRDLMLIPDKDKNKEQVEREKQLLQEIIQVVEEKNQLVQKLESERLLDEQLLHSDSGAASGLSGNVNSSTNSLKPNRKIKKMFKK